MRSVEILTVCGSGTVGSTVLSVRLKEILAKKGYNANMTETSPLEIGDRIELGDYDVVVYISPIEMCTSTPILNGTGFLMGINEEEFVEKFMEVIGKLDLYDD